MSKRDLKKYLKTLKRAHLEEQVIELYEKFKPVKSYYDFVFNPKEDKLRDDAKVRMYKEYFTTTRRRPRKRRSVAQKIIKEYLTLGVNPQIMADIMLFNIETAMEYNKAHRHTQDSFYKSIFNSFEQAVTYILDNGLVVDMKSRLDRILEEVEGQGWVNEVAFFRVGEALI